MEQNLSQSELNRRYAEDTYKADLSRVYGNDTEQVVGQILHDNPSLRLEDAMQVAWNLIPEATAYVQPATQEEVTERAILIHEGYEAERRIRD